MIFGILLQLTIKHLAISQKIHKSQISHKYKITMHADVVCMEWSAQPT